jgi:spoIIIJ-associated protein
MKKDESILFAQKYLEDMLSFFGTNLTVSSSFEDEVIELDVPSSPFNSILIGKNAETLRSFQYVISLALRNREAEISRVNIDIAGYKQQRAEKISKEAREWIEEVRRSGDSKVVDLNAADRRVVHKVATEYSDIRTFSEGEGRERHLTIAQTSS